MTLPARFHFFAILLCATIFTANALDNNLPTANGEGGHARDFEYPDDLRAFRGRALKVDGAFAPDIAFTIRTCPKCKKMYVFGIYPRLSRTPFNDLAAVHRSIEDSIRKPVPKTMYSPAAGKMVPRACPHCGEPERDPHPNRAYFCHFLNETGDDMQIDYLVRDEKLIEKTYWRVPKEGAAAKVPLPEENETAFKTSFGCHFSLRAVWNEIFAAHWDDKKVLYENVSPGLWLIFRPEGVNDDAFREFANTQLKADRDKGVFTRLESPLKIDEATKNTSSYMDWANKFAEKLSTGKSECFVGISLPEMRSIAVAEASTRDAKLNLSPGKPTVAGSGFLERAPLKLPIDLAPLVKFCAVSGLSLHETCSFYLGEGTYALDNAERLGKRIKSILPECDVDFQDGRVMVLRDADKAERKVDLFQVSSRLDPDDEYMFNLFAQRLLRWDKAKDRFGPAPLEREISPVGLPAFIERRIRPAEYQIKRNAAGALFEPAADSYGKRFDLCYTSECPATLSYVDPSKDRFKDIPNVDAARRIYYAEGATLPTYIEAQDTLRFPGGMKGLLECRVAILFGSEVSSLAGEEERASALAEFGGVPDDLGRVHFYALYQNCAALSPRALLPNEFELLQSRVKDFLAEIHAEKGLELNLHFDLPRTTPKGKVLRRKK
ncbi:MAG TPA: hypothetical protein VKX17_18560 [Planctomycetota bacterium]|nr:hypothetical protein [Planctomycetota bacterium]